LGKERDLGPDGGAKEEIIALQRETKGQRSEKGTDRANERQTTAGKGKRCVH
jgi:hypothetical protein